MRSREPAYRAQAFRRAAREIVNVPESELRFLAENGRLTDLPGVGDTTATVIAEALEGKTPSYLEKLLVKAESSRSKEGEALRKKLKGDLHSHSDWSDGGHTIRAMAEKARDLGHAYLALTDHSPRLTIAHGLTAERLTEQLDVVAEINEDLQPFRLFTGIEVDILEDGTLDQTEDLLARVDIVVGSVHSKLRMPKAEMTTRMLRAIQNEHVDVLGHCTGRIVVGRGRPESEFDEESILGALLDTDTALEVNCRPERLDPPKRILSRAHELGVKIAISTDAHATDQLEWQPYGTDRATECGYTASNVVNTMTASKLLAWTNS
jgi:putative hydrolase